MFSPKGGITEEIIRQVDNAQEYIDIAIYFFTYEPVAEAIIRAKNRGVKIRILMDKTRAQGKSSVYQFLLDNDIETIQDRCSGYMHNKIAIIDGRILFTGSYNWSESAEERNEENLLEFIDEEEKTVFFLSSISRYSRGGSASCKPSRGFFWVRILLPSLHSSNIGIVSLCCADYR